jgi:hypothetical protein
MSHMTNDPTQPVDTDVTDPAAAAADTSVGDVAATDVPAPSEEEQALALVDQALAHVDTDGLPPASDDEEGEGDPAADTANKPEGEQAKVETVEEKLAKEASAEADKLGIKNEAANAKFKELYAISKRVPELEHRAARGDELLEHIQSTGANGEQLGIALNYLRAVNSEDLTALNGAWDFMQKEIAWLAEKLGKPLPGKDILEGHPDLQEMVADGTAREVAEEAALARNAAKAAQQNEQRQQQRQNLTAQQQQQQQDAIELGRTQLNDLGLRLKATDAQHFETKFKQLMSERERIMRMPPDRWAIEFELAYLRIPNPAPTTPKPRIGHQALRPTGGNSGVVKAPQTEREALEQGLAMANEGIYG